MFALVGYDMNRVIMKHSPDNISTDFYSH